MAWDDDIVLGDELDAEDPVITSKLARLREAWRRCEVLAESLDIDMAWVAVHVAVARDALEQAHDSYVSVATRRAARNRRYEEERL